MMWNGDGGGHMGSWGWIGMLMMLLFWFGVIALIVWAVSGNTASRTSSTNDRPREDRALSILRERFARGELTEEEYDRARRTLESVGH